MAIDHIKGIFSISHPMQYLHAVEARDVIKLEKTESALLVFNRPFAPQLERLKAIIDPADWAIVRYIPYPEYWIPPGPGRTWTGRWRMYISKLLSARHLVSSVDEILSECDRLEYVAAGNYMARADRYLLAAAEKKSVKEIILLDEGVAMPAFFVHIRNDPDNPIVAMFKNRFSRKDWGGRFMSAVAGLKFTHPSAVTYFTMYDIAPPANDRILKNNFIHIRERVKNFSPGNEIWFIGTADIERNVANRAGYFELMARILTDFPGQQILYLPHRYETEEKLQKLKAMGFDVVRSGMAVEPWLIMRGILPECVASVASTAIDTLSKIFPDTVKIRVYRPSTNYATGKSSREKIDTLIACHLRHNPAIEVIEA